MARSSGRDRSDNSAVPKTVVKITNPSTGLSREATTDSAGYYSIPNLPQVLTIFCQLKRFKPLTKKGVDVLINNVTPVDLRLEWVG